MSRFKFVDHLPAPAKSGRKPTILDAFAKALKANPGQWAEYPKKLTTSSRYTYVTQINRGRSDRGQLTCGGFQASVRNQKLYVRAVANTVAVADEQQLADTA